VFNGFVIEFCVIYKGSSVIPWCYAADVIATSKRVLFSNKSVLLLQAKQG